MLSALGEDFITELDGKLKLAVYQLGEKLDPKLSNLEWELLQLKERVEEIERRNKQFAALVAVEAAKLGLTPEELIRESVNYFMKKFGEKCGKEG